MSLDIGSVRLTERFGLVGPLAAAARAAATAYVDALLDDLGWSLDEVGTWIGVAGTVTTVSALVQELPAYDRARVHGSTVPTDRADRAAGAAGGHRRPTRSAGWARWNPAAPT